MLQVLRSTCCQDDFAGLLPLEPETLVLFNQAQQPVQHIVTLTPLHKHPMRVTVSSQAFIYLMIKHGYAHRAVRIAPGTKRACLTWFALR
mmetsp:Transcript_9085/g.19483  ORF Transcript_9085/g.19483 Transcript_9085/m.19483 type:complete len:90 (-) Transcript_9085:533-802(-)